MGAKGIKYQFRKISAFGCFFSVAAIALLGYALYNPGWHCDSENFRKYNFGDAKLEIAKFEVEECKGLTHLSTRLHDLPHNIDYSDKEFLREVQPNNPPVTVILDDGPSQSELTSEDGKDSIFDPCTQSGLSIDNNKIYGETYASEIHAKNTSVKYMSKKVYMPEPLLLKLCFTRSCFYNLKLALSFCALSIISSVISFYTTTSKNFEFARVIGVSQVFWAFLAFVYSCIAVVVFRMKYSDYLSYYVEEPSSVVVTDYIGLSYWIAVGGAFSTFVAMVVYRIDHAETGPKKSI